VTRVTVPEVTNITPLAVTSVTDPRWDQEQSPPNEEGIVRTRGGEEMAEKKVSPKKSSKKASGKAATRVTKKTSLRRRRRR
jgi:hypothetical protein